MEVKRKPQSRDDDGNLQKDLPWNISFFSRGKGLSGFGSGLLYLFQGRDRPRKEGHLAKLFFPAGKLGLDSIATQNLVPVQAEVAGIAPQKAQEEFLLGDVLEIISFQGFQDGKADTGSLGNLLQGNAPGFPLPP